VTVTLDRQAVGAGTTALPLAADMTLSAEIVIDRRSLLDWLLAPLRDPVRAI
jgi:membrane fusion protein